MTNWKKDIDKSIEDHLELQIRETLPYKKAYSQAKNPTNAQLWVAVANLSKQIFDLNLKIKFLEKALQELVKPKDRKEVKILNKSLKRL